MAEMKEFVLWFVQQFPAFLLEPPISAFVGLMVLMYVVKVIWSMMHI